MEWSKLLKSASYRKGAVWSTELTRLTDEALLLAFPDYDS